jgi:hypothetical protein
LKNINDYSNKDDEDDLNIADENQIDLVHQYTEGESGEKMSNSNKENDEDQNYRYINNKNYHGQKISIGDFVIMKTSPQSEEIVKILGFRYQISSKTTGNMIYKNLRSEFFSIELAKLNNSKKNEALCFLC